MPKSDPNLMTQSEYAASRKARGLSGGTRQAVKRAVDEKRISCFGPDKLVDQELADRQWDRNTRPRVATGVQPPAEQGANDSAPRPQLEDLEGAAEPRPGADPAPPQHLHAEPGYLKSKAAQAEADARISRLKAAELEGQLVRVDQVRAELAAKLAPVREGLLQIPARLASTLAAQSDPGRIQILLEAEIHQVLAPLGRPDPADASASGGAG